MGLEILRHFFAKYIDLPQESLDRLHSVLKERNLDRGETWIQEGEVCGKVGFIIRGLMRSSYLRDGKDITISFSGQGEFLTSMSSFISQTPSYERIEIVDDCRILEWGHDTLIVLLDQDPHLARMYRMILEQYYIDLEERWIFSKFKTAKERYLDLIENKPYIIQKASVGQIASYLDMTIETLSRIRSSI